MSTKELVLKTITDLPEDVSWAEIQERINFMAGIRKGFEEIEDGKGIPHEDLKRQFQSWITE